MSLSSSSIYNSV